MRKINKNTSNHREVEVLDALRRLGGSARNSNIADLLGVSEETVRRTTKALAKADLVRRVHGGAYLPDAHGEAGVFSRLGQRSDEKNLIARATARLIPDGLPASFSMSVPPPPSWPMPCANTKTSLS